MKANYTGGCLCGGIRFAVDAFEPAIAHCHCSMCRKFHGAAFATFASARVEHFRWLNLLQAYTAPNGTTRRFCRHCGSSLTFASPRGSADVVEIALGCLDGGLEIAPDAHIFVGSKADWFSISDDLPQYDAGRSSMRLK